MSSIERFKLSANVTRKSFLSVSEGFGWRADILVTHWLECRDINRMWPASFDRWSAFPCLVSSTASIAIKTRTDSRLITRSSYNYEPFDIRNPRKDEIRSDIRRYQMYEIPQNFLGEAEIYMSTTERTERKLVGMQNRCRTRVRVVLSEGRKSLVLCS